MNEFIEGFKEALSPVSRTVFITWYDIGGIAGTIVIVGGIVLILSLVIFAVVKIINREIEK